MNWNKLLPWNWFKNEEKEEKRIEVLKPDKELALMRVDPFDLFTSIVSLQKEIDDFMNNIGDINWPSRYGILKPTLDLVAYDDRYEVSIEIPGVEASGLKVEVRDRCLHVSGEKKQESRFEEGNYYKLECCYGKFKRVLNLPYDVDEDKIEASYKNGILKIVMPKKEEYKGKAKIIEVRS